MNTAPQQREKISFEPNAPQTLTIEWTPEARPGRYGQQFMYKFKGDKIWFADEEVHLLIEQALGRQPVAGDTLTIMKATVRNPQTNRQQIEWQISQERGILGTPPATKTQSAAPPPSVWHPNQQQQRQQPQQRQAATPIGTQDDSPAIKRDPTSQLAAALFCAFDALSMLSSYASEHGYPLNFNTGDVRALASTMIIQRQENATANAAKGRAA
jgi:hypothetical protein